MASAMVRNSYGIGGGDSITFGLQRLRNCCADAACAAGDESCSCHMENPLVKLSLGNLATILLLHTQHCCARKNAAAPHKLSHADYDMGMKSLAACGRFTKCPVPEH